MLTTIGGQGGERTIGNKALFLSRMKHEGFNVPDGFILDSRTMQSIIADNDTSKKVAKLCAQITKGTVCDVSDRLTSLIGTCTIMDSLRHDIEKHLSQGVLYAVRSSGLKEDLAELSFAGQYKTFLNVHGIDDICQKIIACYQSMFDETVLSYMIDNNLDVQNLQMAVIVQEMVPANTSGVIFTVNPVTGVDKEIIVEATKGLGENLVSGKVAAERYVYNWYDGVYVERPDSPVIPPAMQQTIVDTALKLQAFFGYPVDIEFAVRSDELFILQARAITRILYGEIPDQWTMADFKDGGVSATVCTPYMWSLYEFIWETMLYKFLTQSKIMKSSEMRKLGNMFYGRPYWNASVVKEAMAKVPGYIEKEFDDELGITSTYKGKGKVTGLSLRSLRNVLLMVGPQLRIYKQQKATVEAHRAAVLQSYRDYRDRWSKQYTLDELQGLWRTLIRNDYLQTEGTYFWQIFINTIRQTLFKDKLLKHVSYAEYLTLLGGLDNISHVLPARDMWALGRKITANTASSDYWRNTSAKAIKTCYDQGGTQHFLNDVRVYVETYGYHSDKELDITHQCYFEDTERIIQMVKDAIVLGPSVIDTDPEAKQKQSYQKELIALQAKVSSRKYKTLVRSIEDIRSLLWWREELRDTSTRMYYIIRMYTLKLAQMYVDAGVLHEVNDIFYLKIDDICDFVDKQKTTADLQRIIQKNRLYYNSFKNYDNPNAIGSVFKTSHPQKSKLKVGDLNGVGCNTGIISGTARVIDGLEDIGRLQPNDILVTKFTDTGWTSKFAIIKGVVTEYGGILCHAAIVSREYGIPCVVCVPNATTTIQDGSTIEIDGATGHITIVETKA